MRRFIAPLAAFGLLAATACATSPRADTGGPAATPSASASSATATTGALTVDNQAFANYTVYVVKASGQRIRIGTATGNSRTTLRVPAEHLTAGGQTRFLAEPDNNQFSPMSQMITLAPGGRATLAIPPGS